MHIGHQIMAPAEQRAKSQGSSLHLWAVKKATRDATNQIQAHTWDTEFWFNFFGIGVARIMSFPQPSSRPHGNVQLLHAI